MHQYLNDKSLSPFPLHSVKTSFREKRFIKKVLNLILKFKFSILLTHSALAGMDTALQSQILTSSSLESDSSRKLLLTSYYLIRIKNIFIQYSRNINVAKYFSEKGRHKAVRASLFIRFLSAPKFCLPFSVCSNIV